MRSVKAGRAKAHFIPMQKPELCMMNPWSNCNAVVTEKHRRGICDSDYQTLWDMVNQETAKWEEFEEAGMCRPRRRMTQKRVLNVIVARRSA